MVDRLSKEQRSNLMRAVRSSNTKPEMTVRRMLFSMGYRYRLHDKRLPGKPDIVFPGRKKVIFVHGCFWHRHLGCKRTTTPDSNRSFWENKFARTQERDDKNMNELKDLGWDYLVVWECQLDNQEKLKERLVRFLEPEA